MGAVIEEVVLDESTKQVLEEAISKYYECNSEFNAMKATKDLYNGMLKNIFADNHINSYVNSDGIKVSVTTTTKPIFDEDKLIEYIKSTGVEGIIKTREYVDMEALENAIYHGNIKASELQSFKEDKVTTTLRCTKPKILNES